MKFASRRQDMLAIRKKQVQFIMLIFCVTMASVLHEPAFAQVPALADTLKRDSLLHSVPVSEDLSHQYDVLQLVNETFHHGKPISNKSKSGLIIIPSIASSPSTGSQIGVKAVAGRKLGDDPTTLLSIASTAASVTTKGIVFFFLNHNVYTPGNKWNFQGNLLAAHTVTPDFGLGIGQAPADKDPEDVALNNPERKARTLVAQYYSLREKVYKQVGNNLFVGMGLSFDIRRKIRESDTSGMSPYDIYSDRHGFNRTNYMANGIFWNVQYTTRDNQNRAYKGIYIDAGFRTNQTWLGSSKNAVLFSSDFRKYFSLSKRNPAHVLAFWNWGSYVVGGDVPYLELPGTAKDAGLRSGRGYVTGYFKATKYNYSEVEYRFPILKNQFLSGVAFFHMQTSNDETGTQLFQVWQPGGGAGLRILFNKETRTNLCLDYGFGNYGQHGFFLGLNEAF